MPLLRLEQVSNQVGGRLILDRVSLEILKGQLVTLIGPNGAGKTTLLKLVLHLLRPTSGTIHREGALRLGYMPQKISINTLMPLTVRGFLDLSYRPLMPLEEALDRVGARALMPYNFHALSGGELQRILLARALMQKPHLLVLDEPTQGLDVDAEEFFYTVLNDLRAQTGTTLLMASHDLYTVFRQSDSVVCLNRHVCCAGAPETVQKDVAYARLFGAGPSASFLSPYTHHHDHHHPPLKGPSLSD